jgi:ATP-dependent RNA circularization protein (DNA/RNA ligase family)
MSKQYTKINTLFKRDERNVIDPTSVSRQEFSYLSNNKWECTEKIDGTNIRVVVTVNENGEKVIEFKGKTDNASIPPTLLKKLNELFPKGSLDDIFEDSLVLAGDEVTLYGEGYGAKIQKDGNYIKNGVNFILFDIKIGNFWLQRDALVDIAFKLNIDIVPFIGFMTIYEATEYVKKGFKSTIAENKDYDAEGLVLKNPYGMIMRNGERLITKIKTIDFINLKNKNNDIAK